jgi:hypothetical protein
LCRLPPRPRRRQGCGLDRALDHLRLLAGRARREHVLNDLDRILDLLVAHLLNRVAVRHLQLPRHQQNQHLEEQRWLLLHDLVDGLATAAVESLLQSHDGDVVQPTARSTSINTDRAPLFKSKPRHARGLFCPSPLFGAANSTEPSDSLQR